MKVSDRGHRVCGRREPDLGEASLEGAVLVEGGIGLTALHEHFEERVARLLAVGIHAYRLTSKGKRAPRIARETEGFDEFLRKRQMHLLENSPLLFDPVVVMGSLASSALRTASRTS